MTIEESCYCAGMMIGGLLTINNTVQKSQLLWEYSILGVVVLVLHMHAYYLHLIIAQKLLQFVLQQSVCIEYG